MKIYTKTGDDGTTGLIGGTRIKKHHIRIESYGAIDELNSWLGLIRDQKVDDISNASLVRIQKNLFVIGAVLASDANPIPKSKQKTNLPKISADDIHYLEGQIDQMQTSLPPMTHFILPGGHTSVSYCHIARTVCRRAERQCALLFDETPFDDNVLVFINRLSDYLFVLARKLTQNIGAEEIKWIPE